MKSSEKILLIGGFGFIGKNLIENLYSEYKIFVIGRSCDLQFSEMYPNLKFYKYDFNTDNGLKSLIDEIKPNFIINLISIVTADRNLDLFEELYKTNVNVLLQLYEATKLSEELKFFLQFGTGEEYGNIDPPFSENDREYPNSPYALVKQMTTNTGMMLYNNYKFPIGIVRPGNLFGKYQKNDKFIPYIVEKLLQNETIITTLAEQKRDFIYAGDFSKCINDVLKNHTKFIGEVFNLSTGRSKSLKEIIDFLKNYTKSSSNVEYGSIPYRENEIMDFRLDINKFSRLIGYDLNFDFFESLSNYVENTGGK